MSSDDEDPDVSYGAAEEEVGLTVHEVAGRRAPSVGETERLQPERTS